MQSIVLLVFCAAAFTDFIMSLWTAPTPVKLVPEMLSTVVAAYVLLEGVRSGFGGVATKYWAAFIVVTFIMVCGVLTNSVGAGPVFTGMRIYLRAMPLFLLPALYPFSEIQIRRQLQLLLAVGLLQVPIASYQRYETWARGGFSGDNVVGTFVESGPLSLALMCMTFVVLGLFIRKRIGLTTFLVLFFLLLFPTTINETKATVFLLPLGLIAVIVMGSPSGKRLRNFWLAIGLLGVFGAIFVPIYDLMQANTPYKNERHLVDLFTNEQALSRYMETKKPATVGTTKIVGRGDAVNVPLDYISKDVVHLAFGLGVGNATHSNLGENFTGQYYQLFQAFTFTGFAVFILELGVLGTALVFLLYYLVFVDAIAVARSDRGLTGAIAVGWTGAVAIMAVSTFYISTQSFSGMSYLYWYFAGLVAARRVQMQREARFAVPVKSPSPRTVTTRQSLTRATFGPGGPSVSGRPTRPGL